MLFSFYHSGGSSLYTCDGRNKIILGWMAGCKWIWYEPPPLTWLMVCFVVLLAARVRCAHYNFIIPGVSRPVSWNRHRGMERLSLSAQTNTRTHNSHTGSSNYYFSAREKYKVHAQPDSGGHWHCWQTTRQRRASLLSEFRQWSGHEILKVYTFVQVALIMLIHKVAGSILKVIFMCKVLTHRAPLDTWPLAHSAEERRSFKWVAAASCCSYYK